MFPEVLDIVLSWLGIVVGTVEDIPGVDVFVAVVVKLSVFVNPEAIEKQRRNIRTRIILEPHGITWFNFLTLGRIHLEHPLPPLATEQNKDILLDMWLISH